MRDKIFTKLFYKNINIHPLCDFYFRCQRYEGETEWYMVYKDAHGISGSALVSRKEVKERLKEELEYWYIENEECQKECQVCRTLRESNMVDLREYYGMILPISPSLSKEDMWICEECLKKFNGIFESILRKIGKNLDTK